MSNPFVAEIRIFPFNFPPKGWAFCAGQLLPISQNTALFSLLGTNYGGDGRSNFALPDMQGNAAMHPGQGPGLSQHNLGETGGEVNHTLLVSEMPAHTHSVMSKGSGGQADPLNRLFGTSGTQLPPPNYYSSTPGTVQNMNAIALSPAGSSSPHNNMMPFLTLNYCIAMQGVYPPRT